MLIRGADGRLYRVGPNGAEVVTASAAMTTQVRVAAPRLAMDVGASAELHSARS
ncbi:MULTISPECIES: hypothetical protein [unclassified Azospirillum]|uniref:hypothetical protein n=1 Tax=unclassified Azospirillum TaxID=2630922 RepID=UPI000B6CB015|nr:MULTISPECIES: hypothetical protein [unclassified Azospirillum]SNS78151.1 hypothetical protein SAMN05880556_111121 [Azospirillum sp. RU38E]SNS95412.1 hypothetical protein SAMN05880591_111121 [Azospirillum sp. RU37A]